MSSVSLQKTFVSYDKRGERQCRAINRTDRKQLILRSELLQLPQSDVMLGYMMSDAEAELIDVSWRSAAAAAAAAELEAAWQSPIYQNVAVPCSGVRILKISLRCRSTIFIVPHVHVLHSAPTFSVSTPSVADPRGSSPAILPHPVRQSGHKLRA